MIIELKEWMEREGVTFDPEPGEKPVKGTSKQRFLRDVYDPEGDKVAFPIEYRNDSRTNITYYTVVATQAFFEVEGWKGKMGDLLLDRFGKDQELYTRALRAVVRGYKAVSDRADVVVTIEE